MSKVFPIHTATACQLKWNFSTIYLPYLETASCHRVKSNTFDLDTFNFHNTPEKIRDRTKMLSGEWPGHGCEYCRDIEQSGGISDRMIHLDFEGFRAPKELDTNNIAVNVTPRIVEIYFSNNCNFKCVYCIPEFSSKINAENLKFGTFEKNGVKFKDHIDLPDQFDTYTDKLFEWLDKNIQDLDRLQILGGEPFIQKETQRLINFLQTKNVKHLELTVFSNLSIDNQKFFRLIQELQNLQLKQINIVASIDTWNRPAEYIRSGLNLTTFEKNFEYLLNNTNFVLNINSALNVLAIPSLPDLVKKINKWNNVRTVYWTLMKTGGYDYWNLGIFGPVVADLGYKQAIDLFNTDNSPEKEKYKEYFLGIDKELRQSIPNRELQIKLKTYLEELDRRRSTDYRSVFPEIAKLMP